MPPFNGIPQYINYFVIASTHIYTFAYSSTMESASFSDCQPVLKYVLIENARYGHIMLR